jgi:hypothetical protein
VSGGGQNTIQTQSVPSWLQPYLNSALSQGQALQQSGGPLYYPGQQVAPLNPLQEQGIDSIVGAAGAPIATTGAENANQFMTSGALRNPSSNPTKEPRWYVVRNMHRTVLEACALPAGADLKRALVAAKLAHIDAGWRLGHLRGGFFFCDKAG